MLDNPDAVALVYGIGGSAFLLLFAAGTIWTLARVLYYRVVGEAIPLILKRDAVVNGSFCLSFGLIVVIRFLPLDSRIALTSGNVWWALLTTLPAVLAALTYLVFEVFVIKLHPPELATEKTEAAS